jgi:hypothetical protein
MSRYFDFILLGPNKRFITWQHSYPRKTRYQNREFIFTGNSLLLYRVE